MTTERWRALVNRAVLLLLIVIAGLLISLHYGLQDSEAARAGSEELLRRRVETYLEDLEEKLDYKMTTLGENVAEQRARTMAFKDQAFALNQDLVRLQTSVDVVTDLERSWHGSEKRASAR